MDGRETIWKGWVTEERIGSGAYGDVYKIRRDEYGLVSFAAMKIIQIPRDQKEIRELADSGMSEEAIRRYYLEMVSSLREEIQIMENLKGAPNIVAIEDYTIRENPEGIGWSIYIRMELLQSLNSYRESAGGLTLEEVVRLGVDMCSALESCRKAGVAHRDIKPDNIFRSRYGAFKLGDFGIARQMESMTLRMHTRKGTTIYMAPEVIRKEEYGASVDVYSLGIMLYRYLNHNRLPFMPGYPAQIHPEDLGRAMAERLAGKPMLPPDQADEELAAFVLKACAFSPQDRYDSAESLRQDLERYLYSLRAEHRAPGGAIPKDMYVAYDPQNKKRSVGPEDTTLAAAATATMVGAPAGTRLDEVAPGTARRWRKETPAGDARSAGATGHRFSRKWKVLITVVLVFVCGAGGVVYLETQYAQVPNVQGLPKNKAKAAIEQAGLIMGIDRKEYSDEVAKKSVISQYPGTGQIRRKHTVVHVVISKGTNKVTVPDLIGRTQADAEEALENAHLKVNVVTTSNFLKNSGVVEQSIEAGTRVTRGTEVTITVNESTVRDHIDDWFDVDSGGGNSAEDTGGDTDIGTADVRDGTDNAENGEYSADVGDENADDGGYSAETRSDMEAGGGYSQPDQSDHSGDSIDLIG